MDTNLQFYSEYARPGMQAADSLSNKQEM